MFGIWINPQVSQLTVLAANADPVNVLLNYGGLGVGLLLFIMGKLHTSGEVADLKEQRDKAMARVEEMQRIMMGQTVPTLTGNLDVLAAIKDAVEQQVATQKASDADLLRDVLAELRRGQR